MKGKQTFFFNFLKKEDFLSYDNWKKTQDSNNYELQNSLSEMKYKELVDGVFKYLNEEPLELNRKKSDSLNEEKNKNIGVLFQNSKIGIERKKSSEIEKSPLLNEKWVDYQNKLSIILQNDEFRKYLSEYLVDQLKKNHI